MILRIMSDIRFFLFILAVVLTGFALAFWLISYPDQDLLFGTLKSSFINTYLFMLGQNISADFSHTSSPDLGVFLLVLFMLFMMILMLNLLIALMANSFKVVQSKGLAQWRLEQASMMLEQRFTLSEKFIARHRHFSRVHVLKLTSLADKVKKQHGRGAEWSEGDSGDNALMRLEEVNKSHQAQLEGRIEALQALHQQKVATKLQTLQDATATQLQGLSSRLAHSDNKMDNLESKLDAILAKLSNNNKLTNLLNPFTTTTTGSKEI